MFTACGNAASQIQQKCWMHHQPVRRFHHSSCIKISSTDSSSTDRQILSNYVHSLTLIALSWSKVRCVPWVSGWWNCPRFCLARPSSNKSNVAAHTPATKLARAQHGESRMMNTYVSQAAILPVPDFVFGCSHQDYYAIDHHQLVRHAVKFDKRVTSSCGRRVIRVCIQLRTKRGQDSESRMPKPPLLLLWAVLLCAFLLIVSVSSPHQQLRGLFRSSSGVQPT